MGDQDARRSATSRFAQKICAVTAAAAALLGNNPANAHESDVMKRLFDRVSISAPLVPSVQLPLPLILKSSNFEDALARGGRGHSSHSSHSSHRSHTSHASSSIGGSRPSRAYSVPDDSPAPASEIAPKRAVPKAATPTPTRPSPKKPTTPNPIAPAEDEEGPAVAPVAVAAQSTKIVPVAEAQAPATKPQQLENQTPEVPAARNVPPVEGMDLSDPEVRFQLHTIVHTAFKDRAFIKDRKDGRTKFYEVGDKVDKFTLFSVDYKGETIELKDGNKAPILLKKHLIGEVKDKGKK